MISTERTGKWITFHFVRTINQSLQIVHYEWGPNAFAFGPQTPSMTWIRKTESIKPEVPESFFLSEK